MRKPNNIEGYRLAARRKLPKPVFDFVDGGSGSEQTQRRNVSQFERLAFIPRTLAGIESPRLSSSFCNVPLSMPVMLSPTGMSGVFHPEGERASAFAAVRKGTVSMLSSMASYTLEELATEADPPPWLQLYPLKNRHLFEKMVERAKRAGLTALCLTVDTPTQSRRDRDLANGWSVPPRLTGMNVIEFGRHPAWIAHALHHRRVTVRNVDERSVKPRLSSVITAASASADKATRALDPTVTWDDVKWLRNVWAGKLAIKGILSAEDALKAADIGVDGILVSNHGGRQLDGAISSIEALPSIVQAVGDTVDVAVDGGIRRGGDVIKAMALGAKAVGIGRPWIWGLTVAGLDGVVDVLEILGAEMRVTMMLLGEGDVQNLDASKLISSA